MLLSLETLPSLPGDASEGVISYVNRLERFANSSGTPNQNGNW